MKIPVFVSAPTQLNAGQQEIYNGILKQLDGLNLERRALGRSDYPTESPLKEVIRLARKCSGGVILGFTQQVASSIVSKPGTKEEKTIPDVRYPSPWNNLEAGILFSLRLPILVFKEDGISGGIFDNGVTDVFIHNMPILKEVRSRASPFRDVFLKWQGEVRNTYYEG